MLERCIKEETLREKVIKKSTWRKRGYNSSKVKDGYIYIIDRWDLVEYPLSSKIERR